MAQKLLLHNHDLTWSLQSTSKQCYFTCHVMESLRLTFLVMLAICSLQVRSEVRKTPRCLCRCTLSIQCKSIIVGWDVICALLKIMSWFLWIECLSNCWNVSIRNWFFCNIEPVQATFQRLHIHSWIKYKNRKMHNNQLYGFRGEYYVLVSNIKIGVIGWD